jgi:hypothetical protein
MVVAVSAIGPNCIAQLESHFGLIDDRCVSLARPHVRELRGRTAAMAGHIAMSQGMRHTSISGLLSKLSRSPRGARKAEG